MSGWIQAAMQQNTIPHLASVVRGLNVALIFLKMNSECSYSSCLLELQDMTHDM